MNNNPIGVYDSGMGGLSVWRELRKALPQESLVYLGDGKNCPYGSRPAEEILRLADDSVGFLAAKGCKMIVVACNTATAAAIDYLRAKYPMPIVGMEPAVKPACRNTSSGVVGVVATERSLDGDMFQHTAARYAAQIEVVTAVGEGLVELVENDMEDSAEADIAVRKVIGVMLEKGVDQIVLGCTHYPFLLPVFRRVIADREVVVIDPSPAVARRVVELVAQFGIAAGENHVPSYEFCTFASEQYRLRLEAKAFGRRI